MKKRNLIITTLLVVVAATVAFVSCKKENQDVLLNNTQPVKTFTVPQIDDMNAYLKDFKQRMQASKDDETLTLDEAAWHLSCLANIDFCRINVKYNDFQFDTIDMQVNITNDAMLMSDLYKAYEQMCDEIQQFKDVFNLLNQNLYYIKVSIGAEGNAKIALKTSYTVDSKDLYTHQWYYSDVFEAVDSCDKYFDDDSIYVWNALGAIALKDVLNLYDHHENSTGPFGSAICYTPTRDYSFNYTNTYDPYGTDFYYINSSRVFAKRYYNSPNPYYEFSTWEMCYLLDSYLGLGYDYIDDHLYNHEFPVNWTITPISFKNTNNNTPYYNYTYIYHDLHVEYGQLNAIDPPVTSE